jgi:hypothetical protein
MARNMLSASNGDLPLRVFAIDGAIDDRSR